MDNLLRNAWKYTSQHDHARIEFGQINKNGSGIKSTSVVLYEVCGLTKHYFGDRILAVNHSQTPAKRSARLRQGDHRVCSYPTFHVRLQSRPCLPLRKPAMLRRYQNNTGTRIQAEDVVCII